MIKVKLPGIPLDEAQVVHLPVVPISAITFSAPSENLKDQFALLRCIVNGTFNKRVLLIDIESGVLQDQHVVLHGIALREFGKREFILNYADEGVTTIGEFREHLRVQLDVSEEEVAFTTSFMLSHASKVKDSFPWPSKRSGTDEKKDATIQQISAILNEAIIPGESVVISHSSSHDTTAALRLMNGSNNLLGSKDAAFKAQYKSLEGTLFNPVNCSHLADSMMLPGHTGLYWLTQTIGLVGGFDLVGSFHGPATDVDGLELYMKGLVFLTQDLV